VFKVLIRSIQKYLYPPTSTADWIDTFLPLGWPNVFDEKIRQSTVPYCTSCPAQFGDTKQPSKHV
jgi:hypothetical protein